TPCPARPGSAIFTHAVARSFPVPPALVLSLLAAAALPRATSAQAPGDKLDPLLRPLLDPAVVARIERTPRIAALGSALRRPLADLLVLRREPGQTQTLVDVFVSVTGPAPNLIEALGGRVVARAGSLLGARVPLSALAALRADGRVRYVQAARRVKLTNDLAMQDIRASQVRTVSNGTFTGETARAEARFNTRGWRRRRTSSQ